MLKIARVGSPADFVVKLQTFNYALPKNTIFELKNFSRFSRGHHLSTVLRCSSINILPLEARNRNSLTTSTINFKKVECPLLVPQTRHFSLRSSIESLIATQSGIFKTISESTPVEYCQKYLLWFHDVSGLPWWASIILSTILIRSVVTLPLAIYQQIIIARLENIKLELPALAEEMKKETSMAIRLYGWDERTAKITFKRSMKKQWHNMIIRDNCHPLKTTVLLWFQVPLWVSLSVSFRNLVYMLPVRDLNAQIIFTQLVIGGAGFIPNLTIPDASLILPVLLGLINLAIIEIQQLSRDPKLPMSKMQKISTNLFRGVSIFMVPVAASVPSCLALYWTTSSAYGLVQNLILMSPKVKRLVRIPETVVEAKQPYKMIVDNFKTKLKLE